MPNLGVNPETKQTVETTEQPPVKLEQQEVHAEPKPSELAAVSKAAADKTVGRQVHNLDVLKAIT